MIEQKLSYTAPEAEALVVRFEGTILTVSGKGDVIKANEVDYGDF